ncbi:MAG: MobF family relaxase, partial [Thermoleophilaceae bacterium]
MAKVRGTAAGPYAEYLISRMKAGPGDRGDYYLNKHGRQEAPGRWALGPRGQELLGVEADMPVSENELRNLHAVRFPNEPERELRRVGGNGRATAAIDATFSAPKSVSVVWALGSEETRRGIEAAQERAVDAAFAHAAEHVPMLRRRVDRETVVRERPGELIATVFRHTTARAVDGRPPDPQLHSHVLLHGALREAADGVAAIESRALMVHQRELAAVYRGELADRLRDLGYAIERNTGRDGRYFEIRGVPQRVIEHFSSRHRQVQDRIEWRKQERLHGLRELAELDGERGREARRRLERLEREFDELCGRGERERYGDDQEGERRPLAEAEYELLERSEGLWRLAARDDSLGERARAKLAEIERYGDRLSPAQERVVAKESRAPKGLETHGDLDRHWGEQAAAREFDSRDSEALAGGELEQIPERQMLLRRVAVALTAHRATFVDREARAVAFEVAGSRREAEGLLSELDERGQLIALEDGRFTTQQQRELERHTMRHVEQLAAGRVAAVPEAFVDAELRRLAAHFAGAGGVAPEQEQAIRAGCSDRQLVVIQGQAGTGKSTALLAAARAEQLAGRRVVVTSTGGQAAERLAAELRGAGVDAEGYSTRALQAEVEHGRLRLGSDTTVIHDECGLASTAEQNFAFWACKEGGARLVAVGDRDQNNPVGAGGLLQRIEEVAVRQRSFVALERIVRARDPDDQAMQRALRAGDTQRAVASLEKRGRIVIAATRSEAAQSAAELWERRRSQPDGALVLCETSNEQIDELNAQLQAIRRGTGELGDARAPVPGRPYALHRDDEVVVRAQFEHPGLGTVRNGERGTIAAVEDGRVLVDLGDGERRRALLDSEDIRHGDLRLAYAQHPNPAQGVTTGHAIDLFGALSTRRGQYVSLTRAREGHLLVTSYEELGVELTDGREAALAALAKQIDRDEPEIPSLDLAVLPTRTAGREDALRLVRRIVGEQRIERIAARVDERGNTALAEASVAELAQRAAELRARLEEFPRPNPCERIAARRAERLREHLTAQHQRLEASRSERDRLGRLRRRERDQLDQRIARQEQVVAGTERKIAELVAAAGPVRDPDRWVEQHAGELAEYVQIEGELGQRFSTEYERALRVVRLNPPRSLTDWLGERPGHAIERELWEHHAVRLELHRARHGEPPDHGDPLPQLTPADWRTAPAELARTGPDRPELPAAERLLPNIGDAALDLG